MTVQMVLDLTEKTITVATLASAPMLITSVVVGVLINIIQTVTSIRDSSLTFVPKAGAAALVLVLTLPWVLNVQMEFLVELFRLLGEIGPAH